MDTPGFDTDKEQDVFQELMRGVEDVHLHAKIVGIMPVTRINDDRAEAIDNKLVDFVDKLCGLEYASQVTVVTNFWSLPHPDDEADFEERLGEILQQWRGVLGSQLKHYQHGRRYNSLGEDAGKCLNWRDYPDEMTRYAKEMVARHYGGRMPQDPRIIKELNDGLPLGHTAAGRLLGIPVPPMASPPASTSSSPTQSEPTTQPPSASEPNGQGTSRPPASSRNDTTNSESSPEPSSTPNGSTNDRADQKGPKPWYETGFNLLCSFGEKVVVPAVERGINDMLQGSLRGSTQPVQSTRAFPSHLDFNSCVDHFKARGMKSDLASRTAWARSNGIFSEPGSYGFGVAVLDAIKREPL